jgi:hypothetical protein
LGPSTDPGDVAGRLVNQLDGLADPDEIDLSHVLTEIAQARLRPLTWQLVDEILRSATTSTDREPLRELAEDIAVLLRRRNPEQDGRVPAPPGVLKSINQLMQRSLG